MYTRTTYDKLYAYRSLTNNWNGVNYTVPVLLGTAANTRSGQKVDGWAGRIKVGLSASSPYSVDVQKLVTCVPTKARSHKIQDPDEVSVGSDSSWGSGLITSVPACPESVDMRARRIVHKRINESREALQGWVAAAELGKSKDLVKSLTTKLVGDAHSGNAAIHRIARSLKRHGWSWRRAAKALSQQWLEIMFGLLPTMSDIDAVIEEVQQRRPPKETVRGWAEQVEVSGPTWGTSRTCSEGVFYRHDIYFQVHHRVSYVYGIRPVTDWATRLGFGVESIPGAVWEWTPWSFLLDYVVGIGEWLSSVTNAGFPFYYGTKSVKTTVTKFSQAKLHYTSSNWILDQFTPGGVVLTRTSYTRVPMHSWPTTVPAIRILDSLENPFKVANVAALIGSRVRPW